MSVGGGGVGVHDQLFHGPVALQGFFQLLHDQPVLRAGDHQKLVDVIAHAPYLPDQQRQLGGRGLLHHRAVEDTAAVALTGQARLAGFLGEGVQLGPGKADFHFKRSFQKSSSFLNAGS